MESPSASSSQLTDGADRFLVLALKFSVDCRPHLVQHPFVGLAVFYDANGEFLWRCSGTLVSPTVSRPDTAQTLSAER